MMFYWHCSIIWLMIGGSGVLAQQASYSSADRIIHHFDFDERKLGNLEDIPMHWTRHIAQGFPEYAQGRFDKTVGYANSPSFYLSLEGRSCAYHYRNTDITVEPDSDYRISARIKPDRLEHARAYVSAYYYDANGDPLPETERRSELYGSGESDTWFEADIRMPANVDAAYSIGITVWVTQPSVWWTAERPIKHIEQKDIYGGAWFDDIIVYRLPRVELLSSKTAEGNVYLKGEKPELLVRVGSADREDLPATLHVESAAGAKIFDQQFIVQHNKSVEKFELTSLEAGLYHAKLEVLLGENTSVNRSLDIAVLAELEDRDPTRHRFGLVLNEDNLQDPESSISLIKHLGIKTVKVPLTRLTAESQTATDYFLTSLADAHVSLIGLLGEPLYRSQQEHSKTLLDLLNGDVSLWEPQLAQVVTRYETLLNYWQISEDARAEMFDEQRTADVLARVRRQMAKLTASPRLAFPWPAHLASPSSPLGLEALSVVLGSDVLPQELPEYVSAVKNASQAPDIWGVIQSNSGKHYHRYARIADFAKRLIYAHQSVGDPIFFDQPWRNRTRGRKHICEATEDLLILRTLVAFLDDATYVGPLDVHKEVSCYIFDRDGKALMVMWSDRASFDGRTFRLNLNGADRVSDLWGNVTRLVSGQLDQDISLSPLPVIVFDAETWLARFRQELRFVPDLVPSGAQVHEQEVVIFNPRDEVISGTVKFRAPEGWQIRPSQFRFNCQAESEYRRKIRIQSAPREPAGLKHIQAELDIDAERRYQFGTPMPITLDLEDVDVWVDFFLERDAMVIRHGIVNKSEEMLTFDSFVDAPGRKRESLAIMDLPPNNSVIKEHVVEDVQLLSGREVRIGLRQVPANRTHEAVITVP